MLNIYNSSLINDSSYYKFLKNKRVCIVGPSNNTKNTKQSTYIENFDTVVRLNKTFEIPQHLQVDIGKRTDILYNSMNTTDYYGENNIDSRQIHIFKNKLKYISIPYPLIYPFDKDIVKFMNTNQNMIPYHIINLNLYKYLINLLKKRPYSGTCAIIDLLSFDISELYITGIDCYINKYYDEYRKITNNDLRHLRNNLYHSSLPQLNLIKRLALTDSRVKLDKFLENYFFKNEYKFYKTINLDKFVVPIDISNKMSLNKLIYNKYILFTNKNITRNDIFLIRITMNYENLEQFSNMIINFNNQNVSNIKINNEIEVILDFNNKLSILKHINTHTDINNIYYVKQLIVQYLQKFNIIRNISLVFTSVLILTILFEDLIYIDNNLIDTLSTNEKNILLYYNYIKKIKIVTIK